MDWVLRVVQQCVRSGCRELRVKLSRESASFQGDVFLEPELLKAAVEPHHFELDQQDGVFSLAVQRAVDASGLQRERERLNERCPYVPLTLRVDGKVKAPKLEINQESPWFIQQRYFLADPGVAAFAYVPFVGAKQSDIKVGKKLNALGWRQDCRWPRYQGRTTQGPQVLVQGLGKDKAMPCSALLTLGAEPRATNRILWVQWGVSLDAWEVDLGFPGAWAICSANDQTVEGFEVVDSRARHHTLTRVREEIERLALEAQEFRHLSYPPVPSAMRLWALLAGVGGSFWLSTVWPVFVGAALGRGVDWLQNRRRAKQFWERVEQLAAQHSPPPGSSSPEPGANDVRRE